MRKTVVLIGALAGVVTILDWIERSAWARLMPAVLVEVFPLVFNLSTLTLIVIGLWKILGLEKQRDADATANASEHQDIRVKSAQLEGRMLETMKKTFVEVRRPIEQRLDNLEAAVQRLEEWKMQGGGDTLEALAHRALKGMTDSMTGGMGVKPPSP